MVAFIVILTTYTNSWRYRTMKLNDKQKLYVQSCIDCGFIPSKKKVEALDDWSISEIDCWEFAERVRLEHTVERLNRLWLFKYGFEPIKYVLLKGEIYITAVYKPQISFDKSELLGVYDTTSESQKAARNLIYELEKSIL